MELYQRICATWTHWSATPGKQSQRHPTVARCHGYRSIHAITGALKDNTEDNAHLIANTTDNVQHAQTQHEQNNAIDSRCPVCGRTLDDKEHMYWECPVGGRQHPPQNKIYNSSRLTLQRDRQTCSAARGQTGLANKTLRTLVGNADQPRAHHTTAREFRWRKPIHATAPIRILPSK